MLSSRYLHLHEALGLGPMWLNRGAKVLPAAAQTAVVHATQTAPAAPPQTAAQPATRSHATAVARLAAMAAVNSAAKISDGLSITNRPSEKSLPAPSERPSENNPAAQTAADPAVLAAIRPAAVMVVSICPAPEDSASGQLFSGSAGVLLDNMLAAIGLQAADAHKTAWVKTSAAFTPEPPPEQVAAALPQMQAELAASQARAVLFLGQIFTQPHYADTIAQLCGGTPAFTVPHPARLLRQPQLKKQAWQELKKLRNML